MIQLEVNIPALNGEARGTVTARSGGRTLHVARGDWFSDQTRDRFTRRVAMIAHPDPVPAAAPAEGEAGDASPTPTAGDVALARRAAEEEIGQLLLAQLDQIKAEREARAAAAAEGDGDEPSAPEHAAGWQPDPEHLIDYPFPLRVAEHLIKAEATDAAGRLTLRRYRKEFWGYQPGAGYRPVSDEAVDSVIYRHLDKLWTPKRTPEGEETGEYQKLDPNSTKVREARLAMVSRNMLVDGEMPQWLDGRTDPAVRDVVAFKNGLLDAAAWCAAQDETPALLPLTPEWFSGVCCPFDFDPAAACPHWLDFLNDVFDGDREQHDLLQEWFGYQLVPDNRYEAFMVLLGKPRGGKGTTIEAMTAMLGREQVASSGFAKLTGRFAMEPLLGKLSCILPDASITRATDAKAALEVLKMITGGDAVAVDRKGVRELPEVTLPVRFTIATNEMPQLPDESGALKARLKLLYYGKSAAGREDRDLKPRIRAEAPGIAVWALAGLYRLRANGGFTEPVVTVRIREELDRLLSPVKGFVGERCELAPDSFLPKESLYSAWVAWCKDRGDEPGNQIQFGIQLINAYPEVSSGRRGPRGSQFTAYEGVRLC